MRVHVREESVGEVKTRRHHAFDNLFHCHYIRVLRCSKYGQEKQTNGRGGLR